LLPREHGCAFGRKNCSNIPKKRAVAVALRNQKVTVVLVSLSAGRREGGLDRKRRESL
jgi:hypothetical protein